MISINIRSHSVLIFLITVMGLIHILSCKNELKRFEDLSSKTTGVTFENKIVSSSELNILNYLYFYNGAGVASGDFNNDGLPDLYFVSNQGADKFYLNKGGLKFEDITSRSGIKNDQAWSSGVSVVDINQDGLLDIYICKLGGFKPEYGPNQLWINTGEKDGIPQFQEAAKQYGLNLMTMSTHAAFFDYDLDNDLDLFLLNHSVHPNRSYGKGNIRSLKDSISGDRLLENRDGKFIDVSDESGIFQGKIGYGLGVSIGDLNNDNYPDIYVGNDFFENDYIYINNQDGTFSEQGTTNPELLGHTTHFSMGNALSDLNNDGFLDIVSLDMLPEDLDTYKTSAQEYNYQIYSNYLRNGYSPQYMQNTLHLNRGAGKAFSEIAFISGISSTEWSWSVETEDFDNDGLTDLYITNGIMGATNDMDFINFIANDAIQKDLADGVDESESSFIKKIPEKLTKDYVFKNLGDGTFKNITSDWIDQIPSFSHGSVSVDLDNDGDLELIINTNNSKSRIIKNNSREMDNSNFVKIVLNGPQNNLNGVGSKISIQTDNGIQVKELFPSNSYLSTSLGPVHFGLEELSSVNSITVEWPDGNIQYIQNPEINKTIEINYLPNVQKEDEIHSARVIFEEMPEPGFLHRDNSSVEFNREPLTPFAGSNVGPDFSVSDFNKDGLDDIFMTGAKGQPSQLHLQTAEGHFIKTDSLVFTIDKLAEDVSSVTGDFNMDGLTDIVVVSGGNEFERGLNIKPRLYLNQDGQFVKKQDAFSDVFVNATVVVDIDIDRDGDKDLVIGSNQKGFLFAQASSQYLLINDGTGKFIDQTDKLAPALNNIQHITDIKVADLNNDSSDDLVIVGYWEPVRILFNSGGKFEANELIEIENTEGWWNCVEVSDLNNDGHLDLIAGNWGLNSRLQASVDKPITLYLFDFDGNGKIDPILTHYFGDVETTFASKEDMAKQMPFINKQFLSFKEFASASLAEIFGKEKLTEASKKQINLLASSFFINQGNNSFSQHQLPFFGQISAVNAIHIRDYNNDGFSDLLLTGNYYEISTQLSRLDASHGELFINDQNGGFEFANNSDLDLKGVVRDLETLRIDDEDYLLVGRNNLTAKIFKISISNE